MTAWDGRPSPYEEMVSSLDRANAQLVSGNTPLAQGIDYDDDTAQWVERQLNEMIRLAQEEVEKSRKFYDDVLRLNLGKSKAGQAIHAKMIARASDQEGGALRFWIDYHRVLIVYRDKVMAMIDEWKRADRNSTDQLPGNPR